MAQIYIENAKLNAVSESLLNARIAFGLNAKARLSDPPSAIKQMDSSSFVQYLLYHATFKKLHLPDGSTNQRIWCQLLGLEAENYSSAGDGDNWLRIAFSRATPRRSAHVWLIRRGVTLESHGRSTGPNRRRWNVPGLINSVAYCFKLAELGEFRPEPIYFPPTADFVNL